MRNKIPLICFLLAIYSFSLEIHSSVILRNTKRKDVDYNSIQAAVNDASPGDTVLIKAGTYKETVTIQASGSLDNEITIRNYDDDTVIIDGEGQREHCIVIDSASFINIKGLTLTNTLTGESPEETGAIHISGNSENLDLSELTVTNSGSCGIALVASEGDSIANVTISDCTVKSSYYHGILVYQKCSNITITKNEISYSGWDNNSEAGEGILACNWHAKKKMKKLNPSYIYVTNNTVHHSKQQGIQTWNVHHVLIGQNHFYENGCSGIQVEDGTEYFIVEYNNSHDNGQLANTETGIWIDDSYCGVVRNNTVTGNEIGLLVSKSRHCIVRNNLIYANSRDLLDSCGLMVVQYEKAKCVDTYIIQNTIVRNSHETASEHGNVSLGKWDGKVKKVIMKNNIISSSWAPNELFLNCRPYQSDYNLFYNTKGVSVTYKDELIDFADYSQKTKQDTNSLQAEPGFVDSSNGNFNLASSSPAIDSGDFLTYTRKAGTGTMIKVKDAKFFTDGFGIGEPDEIIIGDNAPTKIVTVDYKKKAITIDSSISWQKHDKVSYKYSGNQPDIGAFETK